jgi:hypothetical protein
MAQTRFWWIQHFRDAHKRREDPGPDDMMKYDEAFMQVLEEHIMVHRHFYVGHEHAPDGSVIENTRTK